MTRPASDGRRDAADEAADGVPVILISGIDFEPMAMTTIGLQWDLPRAVVLRHELNPEHETLICTVSDARGLLERVEVSLEHACVFCALREDVIPTLERLAATGIWDSIIAQLPLTAETTQVCRVIGYEPTAAPHVRIAASLVALSGPDVGEDLLGEDTLTDRELPVRDDDDRGVAEVASAMVEYADAVVVTDRLAAHDRDVIQAIARPDATIVQDTAELDSAALVRGIHHHDHSESWVDVVRRGPLPTPPEHSAAWTLDFRSERPFHPDRLRERIEDLGGGRYRSRGCFWLPSRPHQICQWDGAGGMLSVGTCERWEGGGQLTRIVVVGTDSGRERLADAFRDCLLTDAARALCRLDSRLSLRASLPPRPAARANRGPWRRSVPLPGLLLAAEPTAPDLPVGRCRRHVERRHLRALGGGRPAHPDRGGRNRFGA